jgi:hypothetical protein
VSTRGHGKSGARKYGRNERKCQRYKLEHRREKNKLRKLRKIAKRHPNKQILNKIKELENVIN